MKDIGFIEVNLLEKAVGGLSKPSKMPGFGYSLPAKNCITGSKLVKIEGSVCKSCYALKGHYHYPVVQKAMKRRLNAVNNDFMWEFNMVALLNKKIKKGYFRWHDSGDLQSLKHLNKIVYICKNTPFIQHWLPSREHKIVSEYLKINKKLPPNLCLRMSAHMINTYKDVQKYQNSSTVITNYRHAFTTNICPASKKENESKCGDCRNCWNIKIKNINYFKH